MSRERSNKSELNPKKLCADARDLEKNAREICAQMVKAAFQLDWRGDVPRLVEATLTNAPEDVLKELASVIRKFRALVARGLWLHQHDQIIFRIRGFAPHGRNDVGAGLVDATGAPLNPKEAETRARSQAFTPLRTGPLHIVVDDDRVRDGGDYLRVKANPKGLPETDVLRQRLVVRFEGPQKDVGALFILMQGAAYFRERFKQGVTTVHDLLERERRAIQKAYRDVGIQRSTPGRPPKKTK